MRERSAEQEMLHLGAFKRDVEPEPVKKQFNRISGTLVSILRYVKDEVWSTLTKSRSTFSLVDVCTRTSKR